MGTIEMQKNPDSTEQDMIIDNTLILLPYHKKDGTGRQQAGVVLAGLLATPGINIRIDRTENGKPFLPDYPCIHIGISHSRDVLAVFAGQASAGLDIEYMKPRALLSDMARAVLNTEEYHLFESNTENREKYFYTFWTQKEAAVKQKGRTLTDVFRPGDTSGTGFRNWIVDESYILCLCAEPSVLDNLTVQSRLPGSTRISPLTL